MPLLPPKLAADVMELSVFMGDLGDTFLPSVVCTRFKFILPRLTASCVVVSGVAVSMSAWYVWAFLALAGKAGHSYPSVRTLGDNSGTSG